MVEEWIIMHPHYEGAIATEHAWPFTPFGKELDNLLKDDTFMVVAREGDTSTSATGIQRLYASRGSSLVVEYARSISFSKFANEDFMRYKYLDKAPHLNIAVPTQTILKNLVEEEIGEERFTITKTPEGYTDRFFYGGDARHLYKENYDNTFYNQNFPSATFDRMFHVEPYELFTHDGELGKDIISKYNPEGLFSQTEVISIADEIIRDDYST